MTPPYEFPAPRSVAREEPVAGGAAPVLLVERTGPVARLTLNRPERRNALSLELLSELRAALAVCSASREIRAIVLAGTGPAFSAGHDLGELVALSNEQTDHLFRLCSAVMTDIQATPQPVIARVHGVATAAGCQLVAACDLAVAAEQASFATPGVNIGLFCTTPAVPVVRAIGRKRAMEMLLLGTPIDARTALEWGLVNRLVPAAELDAAVQQLTDRIIAASAHTVALGKRAFYRQSEMSEQAAYEFGSGVMTENAASPDAREGMQAFLGKRKPHWSDR